MIKVLIVEDEQLVARMFQKTLEPNGFEVQVVHNGEEGYKKMKSWHPDIVLMDVMMPKMNGLEALEVMKKDEEISHIPVVIMTNLSASHDGEAALAKGAAAYWVKKDAQPATFAEKVKTFVEGYAAQQQKPAA
jgi:CheY-like chemotaxis protein